MRVRFVALTAAATVLALLLGSAPAHAEPTLAEVEKQVKEKGEELEAVIEEYNAAKENLKKAETRQGEIEKQLKPLSDSVALAQQAIDDIAVSTYQGGNLSQVNIMLSGSPDQTVERLSILNQLGQTQIAEIKAFHDATDALAAEQASLQTTIEEQEGLKKEIGTKKDKIEGELDKLKDLQDELQPPPKINAPPPPSGSAGAAVQFAYDQLGEPYVYGSGGPDSWDCSGLTQGAWRAAGVSLSHNAAMQYNEIPHVNRSNLAAGDLVFYNNLNHVGIYVGDGKVVHAPTSGSVVSVAPVDSMPIVGYGRPG